MLGVEIVRAGGPFFGTGSPAGGDFITTAQLDAAAAAFAALRDELRPPIKLGHNDAQDALKAEGFLASDGAPAAGWLDNLRRDGERMLADFMGMPRVVADLVRAGAYRARSVELWRNYADISGKRHPMVITGVALLGAKLPAVRGLADMVKLYGEAQDGEAQRFYIDAAPTAYAVSDYFLPLADADRAWDEAEARTRVMAWAGATEGPTDGTDADPLSEQVLARLRSAYLWWADGGGRSLADFRYLVADVVDGMLVAVPAAVYIAAGALADDSLTGPDMDRMRNRLGAFYERLGSTPPWGGWQGPECACGVNPCGCGPYMEDFAARAAVPTQEGTMPDTIAPELRAALGVSDDAAGIDVVTAAAVKLGEDAAAAATKLAETEAERDALKAAADAASADADTRFAAMQVTLDTLTEAVKLGEAASAKLAHKDRDDLLDAAVADRKLTPAQRPEWESRYDANPALVAELIGTLTARSDLSSDEMGSDAKGVAAAEDDATYTAAFGEAPREPHTATGKDA